MNREETEKAIEVMQAYVDGAEIESRLCGTDEWIGVENSSWDFKWENYRIKPKPREFWLIPSNNHINHFWVETDEEEAKDYIGAVKVREVL